jgi:metal-dependent HD superfamily phosphatase/phosphodiesterase
VSTLDPLPARRMIRTAGAQLTGFDRLSQRQSSNGDKRRRKEKSMSNPIASVDSAQPSEPATNTGQMENNQTEHIVTIEEVRKDPEVIAFLQQANASLKALGYTEHGQRHAGLVGHIAENVLERLGYARRTHELANIAGYLHDIGNVIHRENHAQSGALMADRILLRMGMPAVERALVMNAIGNHEEERGFAVTPISAAVIIADKADVHRSRVQNPDMDAFDIHDRVNYASTRSFVRAQKDDQIIALELEIDTTYAQVIEYFEIFLDRMTMMRQAVEFLDCDFQLIVNEVRFS